MTLIGKKSLRHREEIVASLAADGRSVAMDAGTAAPFVTVRRSPVHGWGVFTTRHVAAGELAEIAPYLAIPLAEWEVAGSLGAYVFDLDDAHVALGLGCLSLYNHSDEPNVSVWFDLDNGLGHVEALVDIEAGSELFISYSDDGDVTAWGIEARP